MKITNIIFENKQYFETLAKIHNSDQLSVIDAYRINRLVKKLNNIQDEFSKLKQKILIKYGTPASEIEGSYEISLENRESFNTEYSELINIEHDLEIEMLEFPSLKEGISAADLNIMEKFFDLSGFELEEKTELSTEEPI